MDTITLHGLEDALILIPHLIGYRPGHHLVFLALEEHGTDATGRRSCLGPIMSLDLEGGSLDAGIGFSLARALRGSRIESAVLVFYCPDLDEILPAELEVLSGIAEVVDEAIGTASTKVFATYATDADTWGVVESGTMERRPWSELETHPIAAALVYSGSAPTAQTDSRRTILRRTPEEIREATECGDAWLRSCLTGNVPDEHMGSLEWDCLIKQWEDPQGRIRMGDAAFLFGRANMALRNVRVRDRVLHHGVNPRPGRLLSEVSDADLAAGLADSMRTRPDVSHLENLVDLLRHCAAFAADDDPVALSCAAYLMWWQGQNSVAALYVREALEADAHYPLAELLADSLCGNVHPGWLDHDADS